MSYGKLRAAGLAIVQTKNVIGLNPGVQPSQIASNRCGASTLESIAHIRHYRKLVIRANDLTEPAPLDGVA
jgi:hypothetical protein